MCDNAPLVSIICLAYNHEKYIAKAIEGFLMQKTTFSFEVLVHDDASTDSTARIIQDFEKKYPEIIKPTYQIENQYTQGVNIIFDLMIPKAKGKYLALCEGDDFWVSPFKLQMQFDAMEEHPEIDLCAHDVKAISARSGKAVEPAVKHKKSLTIFSIEEVIVGEGGFFGTNTLFFRKEVFDHPPNFYLKLPYDYTTQILGALRGGVLYLPECMSVYRFGVPGSWTSNARGSKDFQNDFLKKKKRMLFELNEYTNGAYKRAINARLLLYDISSNRSPIYNLRIFLRYKNGFRYLPKKAKVTTLIKCICPWILVLKSRLFKTKRSKELVQLKLFL